jgi:hypothetical protein
LRKALARWLVIMSESAANKVRLYELALANGRSASPFVWRIRYALAHKGIAFETVKLGFTEIPAVFGGKFKTVPILEHGDTVVGGRIGLTFARAARKI